MKQLARTLLLITTGLLLAPSAAAADSRAAIADVVRSLGYGGAIHHFKNFVLRGEKKYHDGAQQAFKQAGEALAAMMKDGSLSEDEQESVAAISRVISLYSQRLSVVAKMWQEGDSVEAIDEAVTIDDTPAIKAIDRLRAAHDWSDVENLDYHLGYGSGIHSFKNFVLRADAKYRARATLGLSNVLLIVARFRADRQLSETHADALDKIESVVRAYETALPKVDALIGEGQTAREVDAAVTIDDGPALSGLAALRK